MKRRLFLSQVGIAAAAAPLLASTAAAASAAPVALDAIATDLDASHTYLYNNYRGMKGAKSLEEISASDSFIDFRAKLYFLYEAINDTHGPDIGYPWVIYFFANMTRAEVAALAEESNDYALSDAVQKQKLLA